MGITKFKEKIKKKRFHLYIVLAKKPLFDQKLKIKLFEIKNLYAGLWISGLEAQIITNVSEYYVLNRYIQIID